MQDPNGSDMLQKSPAAGLAEYMSVPEAIDFLVKAQMAARGLPTSESRRQRALEQKDPNWNRTSVDELMIERQAGQLVALAVERGALQLLNPHSLLPFTQKITPKDSAYLDALLGCDELRRWAREYLRVETCLPEHGRTSNLSVSADCRGAGDDVHASANTPHEAGASDEPGEAKREPAQADPERSPIGPKPLDTRTLADALDGIEDRRADEWRRLLGDAPKWAMLARVSPGVRGRAAATWNPVALAHALTRRGVTQAQIARLFRERVELEAWRDERSRSLSAFAEYGLD